MTRYAGADWVQTQFDALHKYNPKKNSKVEMSEIGRLAADLLGEWQYGIYHISKEVMRTDWTNNHWIEISLWCSGISTYDFNDLTRLVFLAHDFAVRIEIEPSTHHHMRLVFHKRTHGESDGKTLYHPTLEEAVNLFRQTNKSQEEG